jgi:peptidoglycan/xylan/chitin deacetylase (PgdA/CDA1 family)
MLRLLALLKRYGITSSRAKKRTVECVKLLSQYDCHPTFPTPGRVVSKNAEFCRELQKMGAEFAVHGYDHVDFRNLSQSEVTRQFIRATNAFYHSGIQIEGFRCPYLSYTDDLRDAMPDSTFKYSSNRAIWWNVVSAESKGEVTAIFDSLLKFYRPASSETTISTPRMVDDLLEIPASLPDDLQLYDGLKLGEEGLKRAWLEILRQTYQRGELFVLMFHPETFERCKLPFECILSEARLLQPTVWLTQLRDVSKWWREKSGFVVHACSDPSGLHIRFDCSERATVLIRNIETSEPTRAWYGSYEVLESRTLHLAGDQRPFVGVSPTAPAHTIAFLREQGYIIETSEQVQRCGVHLDAATLAKLESELELLNYIDSSPGPLVRFWRWPGETRSSLCITGDLDALSLVDYASRLFTV